MEEELGFVYSWRVGSFRDFAEQEEKKKIVEIDDHPASSYSETRSGYFVCVLTFRHVLHGLSSPRSQLKPWIYMQCRIFTSKNTLKLFLLNLLSFFILKEKVKS